MDKGEVELRTVVAARLRARREDLERSIATRVYAISEPTETADPVYLDGLRNSLIAAVAYALDTLELGERRAPDVPPSLLAQARMAARSGIGLDTVLRRYAAGYALIVDFVFREGARATAGAEPSLRPLFRGQAAIFDRLIAAVSEEHRRESARLPGSSGERQAERVRRLLAGEAIDLGGLGYELDGHHLGLVATDSGAERPLREIAATLGLCLLCVPVDGGGLWAWLGSPRSAGPLDCGRVAGLAEGLLSPDTTVALGFPAEGLHGWRLTHRQAMKALSVSDLHDSKVIPYEEVALLACISGDDLLRQSLQRIYLRPLSTEPDRGETLKRTLQAYFAHGRQISSTAAAVEASRQTIGKRLKAVEALLGRPLDTCAGELEIALRYADHTAGR